MRAASSGSSATRLGQPLGVLLHEVAVHEEQPLQRHVGREALLGGLARAREVEQLQELVELVAADACRRSCGGRPSGVSGTDGPPMRASSAPETNSTESRICSALRRWRLARQ